LFEDLAPLIFGDVSKPLAGGVGIGCEQALHQRGLEAGALFASAIERLAIEFPVRDLAVEPSGGSCEILLRPVAQGGRELPSDLTRFAADPVGKPLQRKLRILADQRR